MPEEHTESPQAADYRRREADMRQAAEGAELPGPKQRFLEAADRWRRLAELAEAPRSFRGS